MMKRLGYAVVASAVLASLPLGRAAAQAQTQGQAPGPTMEQTPAAIFRAAVDYVEIDATVTDANGRVVTDLTREDFEVTEGGHPQTIESFSHVTLPTDLAPPPTFADHPVEADVQLNEGHEGRLYVFVFDDLHIDASRTLRARSVAKDFIASQFRPNDLGAVLFTSGSGRAGQDFTSNRRLLLAAVDRLIGEAMPTMTEERMSRGARTPSGLGMPSTQEEIADVTASMQRVPLIQRTLRTLLETSEFLADVRGRRKALLFFSEGISYDITDVMGETARMSTDVLLDMQRAIAAATRGNVRFYAIDPRGLDFDTMPERSSLITRRDGKESIYGLSVRANEMRLAQDSLRSLAVNTGGLALVNRNDLTSGYAQIVAENSSYFVLGYSSTNNRQDGKFRKVTVKVKRPGLRVRARGGYYASRGQPATDAGASRPGGVLSVEALASPLALNAIPIRMFAAAFRPASQAPSATDREDGSSRPADVMIAAELDVSQFTLTPTAGDMPAQVEIAVLATSVNGKVTTGPHYAAPLSFSPGAAARVRANRLRVLSHLSLAPGRYQIRLASTVTDKVGSVVYDLDVPDFFTAPLSMSGVAITSNASVNTTTFLDTQHPLALSGPPVATRRFTTDEELSILVELYQKAGARRRAVTLTVDVQDVNGVVVRHVVEPRAADRPPSASGGDAFMPRLSLQGLAPGPYLLHVEGRADGLREPVTRDIQIDVVP